MDTVAPRDVTWAQDRFSVHVNVRVPQATDISLQVTDGRRVIVAGSSGATTEPFLVQLRLAHEVQQPQHGARVLPGVVRCVLHKKKSGEWERLVSLAGAGASSMVGVRGLSYDWDLDAALERQAEELGLDEVSSENGSLSSDDGGDEQQRPAPGSKPKRKEATSSASASTTPTGARPNEEVQRVAVDDRRTNEVIERQQQQQAKKRGARSRGWPTAVLIAGMTVSFGVGVVVGGAITAMMPWPPTPSGGVAARTAPRQPSSSSSPSEL